MLFEMTFKVVELKEGSSVVVTTYLRGSKRNVKKDIEMYKQNAKRYEMFGNEGMIVWA